MRIHLDRGFDIPHVIVSDGSLTSADTARLEALPNVLVEPEPIEILIGSDGNPVPKAPLLGKLQCHKRCFDNHGADRAILFDCDIFFFRNWDSDLRKILTERAIVLRDWGSSLGPNTDRYTQLYGIQQDKTTPNCNTGIIGINKEDYHLVEEKIALHLKDTFMIMEDQGIMFAAFYGNLSYVNNIVCVINGAENIDNLWEYYLDKNAVHLMGMRARPRGLLMTVNLALKSLPKHVNLQQFSPAEKYISFGLLEYGHYNFGAHLQKIPTTCKGRYLNDALHMHGGSWVRWKLPKRCKKFTAQLVCADTGIWENVKPVIVNGKQFKLNEVIDVELEGSLEIRTQDGPGAHIAFLEPRVIIDRTTLPDLSKQTG